MSKTLKTLTIAAIAAVVVGFAAIKRGDTHPAAVRWW